MGGDVEITVYPGAYHAFDATFAPTSVTDAQTHRNCTHSINVDTLVTTDRTTGDRITDYADPAPAASTTNYTALWWNPAETGWGVNFTHQGNILFGTLFTYDASGRDLWLVMSAGGGRCTPALCRSATRPREASACLSWKRTTTRISAGLVVASRRRIFGDRSPT